MYTRFIVTLSFLLCLFTGSARADYSDRPEVQAFIQDMVARQHFQAMELIELFRGVKPLQSVLDAISRPAEGKPWHQYRPIFLTDTRINEGVTFWNAHADLLQKIESQYGVPAAMVVAIVGVETRYGKHVGKYSALASLTTLAFDYPPRGAFFRSELEQFLLLVRDEGLDPKQVQGSYAAAMGMSQFISSSYRNYAVDFDADGRRDLWSSPADALGSVANYFAKHGWRSGQPVALRVTPTDESYQALLDRDLKPKLDREQLQANPATKALTLSGEGPYRLFELEGESAPEVWLGYPNFYVITRYNHSPLYAMAAWQLGEAIQAARQAAASPQAPAKP